MKIFIAICALVALANAEFTVKTPEQWTGFRRECIEENHVPEGHVAFYKKFEYPDDTVTHRYIQCVVTKLGVFDHEHGYYGNYVAEQLAQNRDKDAIYADVEKCLGAYPRETDTAHWAYTIFKCFIENNIVAIRANVHAH